MEAKGFFQSLFDYSFSSFIAARIIKVLYVLTTIIVALDTLALILFMFKVSSALGIFALLILGPLFFVITMIYVRVILELLMVIFRIHADVREINVRGGGGAVAALPARPEPVMEPPFAVAPVAETPPAETPPSEAPPAEAPAAETLATKRFCKHCGAEVTPGNRFCTACGEAAA
jgi:hypothetical protein